MTPFASPPPQPTGCARRMTPQPASALDTEGTVLLLRECQPALASARLSRRDVLRRRVIVCAPPCRVRFASRAGGTVSLADTHADQSEAAEGIAFRISGKRRSAMLLPCDISKGPPMRAVRQLRWVRRKRRPGRRDCARRWEEAKGHRGWQPRSALCVFHVHDPSKRTSSQA